MDNTEAENSWRLYEAWVQHIFPDAKIPLLLRGEYDVNSEFDVIPTTQLFINSSRGIGAAESQSFSAYTGAGVVYTGLIRHCNQDQLGLVVASPWSSPDYQIYIENDVLNHADFKTNTEATYLSTLCSFLQLQLETQYVINSNTIQDINNAIVADVRMLWSF